MPSLSTCLFALDAFVLDAAERCLFCNEDGPPGDVPRLPAIGVSLPQSQQMWTAVIPKGDGHFLCTTLRQNVASPSDTFASDLL
jgi:hypothetical protein